MRFLFVGVRPRQCVINALSSAILAFGLYNVHSLSGVTEGGGLGLVLLLEYWFDLSPAVSGPVFNAVCYLLGWRLMGRLFIIYSAMSTIGFSIGYKLCEQFPPLWPDIAQHPLLAAVIGALFVGITVGVCVRNGAAPGGDDALAMSISHVSGIPIQRIYLAFDMLVLALSLSYIPLRRIVYSVLTVVLSGQLIGLIQRLPAQKTS